MKRWLVAVLAMMLLLSVCGCSDAGTKTQITRKTGTTSASKNGEVDLPWEIDESRGYFADEEAYPAMSGNEPVAVVRESYFTNNGYLCVELLISNGTEQPISIDRLDVTVLDSVSDEMFAGSVSDLGGSLVIAVSDVAEYALYIAPQHVYAEEMESVPEEMFFEIVMDFRVAADSDEWAMDASRGHYVDEGASPELSGDGPMAAVRESYFTNNGHLCVALLIGNGTDMVVSVDAIEVSAYDYSTDEYLGGGKIELEEPFTIDVAGVEEFPFYVAPEHLSVGADATIPELMSFEISIDYTPGEFE